ncbi:MAG: hypothetical protein ACR2PT_02615 [Endozoicomonas sp.]
MALLTLALCLSFPENSGCHGLYSDQRLYCQDIFGLMDVEIHLPGNLAQLSHDALQDFCLQALAVVPLFFVHHSMPVPFNLLAISPYFLLKAYYATAPHLISAYGLTQLSDSEYDLHYSTPSESSGTVYRQLYSPMTLMSLAEVKPSQFGSNTGDSMLSKIIGYSSELLPQLSDENWVISHDGGGTALKENDNNFLLSVDDVHRNQTFLLQHNGEFLQMQEDHWEDDKRMRSWLTWPVFSEARPAPLVVSYIADDAQDFLGGKTVFVIPEWLVPMILRQGFMWIYGGIFSYSMQLLASCVQLQAAQSQEMVLYSDPGRHLAMNGLACEGITSTFDRLWVQSGFYNHGKALLPHDHGFPDIRLWSSFQVAAGNGKPVEHPGRGSDIRGKAQPDKRPPEPPERNKLSGERPEHNKKRTGKGNDGREQSNDPDGESGINTISAVAPDASYLDLAAERLYKKAFPGVTGVFLEEMLSLVRRLNRGMLVQVLPVEGQSPYRWPLVMSSQMERYLDYLDGIEEAEANGQAGNGRNVDYYRELRPDDVNRLLKNRFQILPYIEARIKVYETILKLLKLYSDSHYNPIEYRVYGGYSVNMFLMEHLFGDGGRTQNSLVVTNDIDALMSRGDIDEFLEVSRYLFEEQGITLKNRQTMSFPFPCDKRECFFNGNKITFEIDGYRTQGLPSLDISFPEGGQTPRLLDSYKTLMQGLSRSIELSNRPFEIKKSLDRVLWLKTVRQESALNRLYLNHFTGSRSAGSESPDEFVDISPEKFADQQFRLAFREIEKEMMTEKLRELELSLDETQRQSNDYAADYTIVEKQLENLREERLFEQQEFREQRAEAIKQLKLANEARESLTSEVREYGSKFTLQQKVYKTAVADMKEKLMQMSGSNEEKAKALEARVTGLESKAQSLGGDARKMQQEIQDARGGRAALIELKEQLDLQLDSARGEIKEYSNKLTMLKEGYETAVAGMKEKLKQVSDSNEEQVGALKVRVADLGKKTQSFRKHANKWQKKIEGAKEEKGTLIKLKEELGLQLENARKELNQQILLSEKEIALLKKEKQETVEQQVRASKAAETLRQEIASFEAQVRNRGQPSGAVEKPMTGLKSKKQEQEQELQRTKNELQQTRKANWRQQGVMGAMLAALTYAAYEYEIKPRYRKLFHACRKLSSPALQKHCIKREKHDEAILEYLMVYDQLPRNTRVLEFSERKVDIGYVMINDIQVGDQLHKARKKYPLQHMMTPESFIAIDELSLQAWDWLIESSRTTWLSQDGGEVAMDDFARASLLMCGLQVNMYWQDECNRSLLAFMTKAGFWPHERINRQRPMASSSEYFVTRSLGSERQDNVRLALLPAWVKSSTSGLEWRDLLPYYLHQNRLQVARPSEACRKRFENKSYECPEGAGGAKIWYFAENHWKLAQEIPCTGSPIDVSFPERIVAIWIQATSVYRNDVFGCYQGKSIKGAWEQNAP